MALGALTLIVTPDAAAIPAKVVVLTPDWAKVGIEIAVFDPTGTLGADATTLGAVVTGAGTNVLGLTGAALADPLDGGMIDAPPNGRLAVGTLPVIVGDEVAIFGMVEILGRIGIAL